MQFQILGISPLSVTWLCMTWFYFLVVLLFRCVNWGKPERPQYSQEWYVRQVHENLLNKNDLPLTVAECVRTSHLQKYTERIQFNPHC